MFQTIYLILVTGRIFFLPVSTNIQLEQYHFYIILCSLFKTQLHGPGCTIINDILIESNDISLSIYIVSAY